MKKKVTVIWRVARLFLAQHTKVGKIYQTTIKYTKWAYNITIGCQIYKTYIKYTTIFYVLKAPPKLSQIRITGLKIYHLATLLLSLRIHREIKLKLPQLPTLIRYQNVINYYRSTFAIPRYWCFSNNGIIINHDQGMNCINLF
jgi:hypothetical protein